MGSLTWLVLLEFLEWPISTAFCCCCCVGITCIWFEPPDNESANDVGGSEDSELPESVITDDINDNGSISTDCWCSKLTPLGDVFFFVNEPKPFVDEFSSRTVGNLFDWICVPVIPITVPKSSCDVICLLFRLGEGLKKKLIKIKKVWKKE